MRDKMQGKSLLVCMSGNTSLMASKVMAESGISTQSLNGGITGLPAGRGRNPGEYIQNRHRVADNLRAYSGSRRGLGRPDTLYGAARHHT